MLDLELFLANLNNRFYSKIDTSHKRQGTVLLVATFNRLSNKNGKYLNRTAHVSSW